MRKKIIAAAFLAAGATTAVTHAAILFDFGTNASSTVDATATPALGGPAGLSGTLRYNGISASDGSTVSDVAAGGLVDSSNAVLAGVSADFGVGSETSIDWTSQPFARVGVVGGRSGTGVFSNTIYGDFIGATNSNGTPTTVGMRLSGLAAGEYDVWVVTRHTYVNNDNVATDDYDIYVGGGSNTTAPNTLPTASVLQYSRANASANTGSWAAGDGFTWRKITVDLKPGQDLLVFSETSFENQNGILNAVQITPVPEPTALAVLGLGGLALVRRRR
jgi:hypothetical protein